MEQEHMKIDVFNERLYIASLLNEYIVFSSLLIDVLTYRYSLLPLNLGTWMIQQKIKGYHIIEILHSIYHWKI